MTIQVEINNLINKKIVVRSNKAEFAVKLNFHRNVVPMRFNLVLQINYSRYAVLYAVLT